MVTSDLALLMEGLQRFLRDTGRGFTSNTRLVTIEVLRDLFQRCVAGLDKELYLAVSTSFGTSGMRITYEVDNDKFNRQPTAVYNIVFPRDLVECHWVDVVIEEESQVDKEEHDCHSPGTNLVGDYFEC